MLPKRIRERKARAAAAVSTLVTKRRWWPSLTGAGTVVGG
jgi:hypothetical protein